jgi:hypothetical protein
MTPILTLEAEIRAALKTAGVPRGPLDLLSEIRAGVKLAGEAAVTPPSTPPPTPKPPTPAPPAAAAAPPPAPTPVTPAPAAPPAGTPPAGTPAPGAPASGKPTQTPPPPAYQIPQQRPRAQPGVGEQVWNGVKNNWDVAAIPLSLLAMMFGGKTGRMLGALGMAAGGYGLYNRYKSMTNYGAEIPRTEGESDAAYESRRAENLVKNMNVGYQAAEAKRQAAPLLEQATAAEKQLQTLVAADPKAQPLLEARSAMWEAKQAYNDALKTTQDPAALAEALRTAQTAEQAFQALPQNQEVLKAQEALDAAKYQYEKKLAPWTKWERDNPTLGSSFKGVHTMAPGVLKSQIQAASPELAGATDRTVNDLMYRLGHADKPSDYSREPMTEAENQADRAMAWMLKNQGAAETIRKGGPGIWDRAGIWFQDSGQGKRWE